MLGVVVTLPADALKLNAELLVAGGVDGLLAAPNVISEAERRRELERSGGAVNELISDTCLLIVGEAAPAACDPKPGNVDAEVLGELKLKAVFVVGEEAEAEVLPNANGVFDVGAGEPALAAAPAPAPKLKLPPVATGLAGLLDDKLKALTEAAVGLPG